MKITELKKNLKKDLCSLGRHARIIHPWELLKFKHLDYLEIRLSTESYCLKKDNEIWKVYYEERGITHEKKIFILEDEACKYFEDWINQIKH